MMGWNTKQLQIILAKLSPPLLWWKLNIDRASNGNPFLLQYVGSALTTHKAILLYGEGLAIQLNKLAEATRIKREL